MGTSLLGRARAIRHTLPFRWHSEERPLRARVPAFTVGGPRLDAGIVVARRLWESAPAVAGVMILTLGALTAALILLR